MIAGRLGLVHNDNMKLSSRVEQLYAASAKVMDDCALDNGAIVAANSDLKIYPATAENYRFSWARDAAYQLLATHALDPRKANHRAKKYAKWLKNVWQFSETGLYLKRYGTNGALDVRYGEHHQPDQAGALISALDIIVPEPNADVDEAIRKMADGLSGTWNGFSFGPTQDLWENRETTYKDKDVFTYTTASVIHGLHRAITRFADKLDTRDWKYASDEMNEVLKNVQTPHYLRKIYPSALKKDPDNTIDASLAGLAYPFHTDISDIRTKATVRKINDELYRPGIGVFRYKGDTYDGIVREGSRESKAGAWPLLTFWQSIALDTIGEHDKAVDQYFDTIERLDREYKRGLLPHNVIPEQIYPDDERQGKGVLPLAWSHAKFVLATKALGILEKS